MSNNRVSSPRTLQEAIVRFSGKKKPHDYLVKMRWPNGPQCTNCHSKKVGFLRSKYFFYCKDCRRQFSVRTGTVLEDSRLGYDKWVIAIWQLCNTKNGITSVKLAKDIGISQKSAWFLLHRIRYMMDHGIEKKFSGTVEMDEAYIGGRERNKHWNKTYYYLTGQRARGSAGKIPVAGFLQRATSTKPSQVRANTIPAIDGHTICSNVLENVRRGSNLYTDEFTSYSQLTRNYRVYSVDHASRQYATGDISTNGIENFWSGLKRTLRTYYAPNPYHLNRYIKEQEWRFNERTLDDGQRFVKATSGMEKPKLSYKELTFAAHQHLEYLGEILESVALFESSYSVVDEIWGN